MHHIRVFCHFSQCTSNSVIELRLTHCDKIYMVRTVDVTVFGAGVVGLTSAIAMAEAGLTVRVIAEATGSGTTSHGSGALWRPVFAGAGSTIRWGAETYAKLAAIIAKGSGEAAVRSQPCTSELPTLSRTNGNAYIDCL